MDTLTKNYLVNSYPNRGVTFVAGEGMYLIGKNGEKYLDLGSQYGVSVFGYRHPRITPNLISQLNKLINVHGSFGSDVRTEAAKKLVEACGGRVSRVFFSNSGAEAIETAIKFAKLYTGKLRFLALENSYHGKTLGALSATSGEKYRDPFMPLVWNFIHLPFGEKKSIDENINSDTAAVIIEPVQGEGGIYPPPAGYLEYIQKVCRKRGVLLIIDEIQTGVGRTGRFLASEKHGLTPDIICLGKGIAGGVPIGITLVSEAIALKVPLHIHTSTFGGNPLACSGIIAVLKEFEDGQLLSHIKKMGNFFLTELKKLKHPKIVDTRGIGLMLGLELNENVTPVLKALQQEKIIAIPAGSNIVRFLPPYLITEKEIDRVIKELKKIFS
ncbi:hypothetical protein A2960_00370 [Candidatus Gottesmanbacteria bacterium RIFCSPLOWO2_01_FULL_39_12b]|uniref:Acetylornithine aminotransferase n=1 Tax=Candidatus Gottesmanbacteria bacterium RIFCSPLOWO2_01_FULL_39_12b TaxID=1798388 RepID=A0A1F6ARE2_9BACT|nr:MAG: hypothetical protein A2960_00370 [Candidatus Gottesmanbacteria bacterium RIFCSPLOWO2_01_FULL_39_12b]